MVASLVLAASLMGQPPTNGFVGPPRPPAFAPALPDQLFFVVMPGPTAEDLRIQAAMDAYCMDANAGMRRGPGYPHAPIQTFGLRRDTPAGVYLVGRMRTTTPIPLGFAPYLGQSPANR